MTTVGIRMTLKMSVNTPTYLTGIESQTIVANKSLQLRIILYNGGHCDYFFCSMIYVVVVVLWGPVVVATLLRSNTLSKLSWIAVMLYKMKTKAEHKPSHEKWDTVRTFSHIHIKVIVILIQRGKIRTWRIHAFIHQNSKFAVCGSIDHSWPCISFLTTATLVSLTASCFLSMDHHKVK